MEKKINLSSVLLIFTTLFLFVALIVETTSWICYLGILVLCLISSFLINDKDIFSANFLFSLFFTYTLGFGPVILLFEKTLYNFNYFGIILGGFVSFLWGNRILNISKNKVKKINNTKKIKFISVPRIYILKLLFWISEFACLYYLRSNFNTLFTGNLNAGRIESAASNGLILYASQLSVLLIPMMYDLMMETKDNKVKNISKFSFIFYCILSCVSLLVAGFRAPIVTMFICLIILHFKKNNLDIKKMIKYGILLIFLVEGLSVIRNLLSTNNIETHVSLIESFRSTFIVNSINLKYVFNFFPSRVPFQYGYTYLINILMLLPGPDLDFTLWLKQQLNLSFAGGGVTPTILGEFYINYGIIFIYVGMFLLAGFGNKITKDFNYNNIDFLGAFYIWQFAHCASGGIANVMILTILYTIVYKVLFFFKPYIRVNGDDLIE